MSHKINSLLLFCLFVFLVFLLFLCSLYLDVLLRSVSETLGAESRHRCHPRRHHCHSCCHTQSHCWLNLRSGNPTYEGGAVHQDGHPHHIPAEQELPAVFRHLGETGSKYTRYNLYLYICICHFMSLKLVTYMNSL